MVFTITEKFHYGEQRVTKETHSDTLDTAAVARALGPTAKSEAIKAVLTGLTEYGRAEWGWSTYTVRKNK